MSQPAAGAGSQSDATPEGFLRLCHAIQTGGHAEAQERLAALQLHPDAMKLARAILERKCDPNVHVMAAVLLREAALRRWSSLPVAAHQDLRSWAVRTIATNPAGLDPKSIRQVIGVLARFWKRAWLAESPAARAVVFQHAGKLLRDGSDHRQQAGAHLLDSLLGEFSSASAGGGGSGMPFEFHAKSAAAFETDGLGQAFDLAVAALAALGKPLADRLRPPTGSAGAAHRVGYQSRRVPGGVSPASVATVSLLLRSVEACLDWRFGSTRQHLAAGGGSGTGAAMDGTDESSRLLRPPTAWRDRITAAALPRVLLELHFRSRHVLGLAVPRIALRCLTLLCGLAGPCIEAPAAREQHARGCCTAVLRLLQDPLSQAAEREGGVTSAQQVFGEPSVAESHWSYRSEACLAAVKLVAGSGADAVLRTEQGRALLATMGKVSVELQGELVDCSRHALVLAQRRAILESGGRVPPLDTPSRAGLPASGKDEVASVADAVKPRELPASLTTQALVGGATSPSAAASSSSSGASPAPLVIPPGTDEELAGDLLQQQAANARECSDRALQMLVTCVDQHAGAVRERMYEESMRGGGGAGAVSRTPFGGASSWAGASAPAPAPAGPPSEQQVWVAAVRDPAFTVLGQASEALCDAYMRGKLQSCALNMRASIDDSTPYEDPTEEREELENFAALARATAPVTLRTLCFLIEAARGRLQRAAGEAARAAQSGSGGAGAGAGAAGGGSGPTAEGRARESLELDVVHESLYWLLSMAGHALADDDGHSSSSLSAARGEVPPLLNALSSQAAKRCKAEAKRKAGQGAHPRSYGPQAERDAVATDPVVRLVVLSLAVTCDECKRAGQGGAAQAFASPVLAARSLWFLRRWFGAYACSESDGTRRRSSQESSTLHGLYVAEEREGEGPLGTPAGARSVVSFLVRAAGVAASRWCAEEEVVEEAVALLKLVARDERAGAIAVTRPEWTQLVRATSAMVRGGIVSGGGAGGAPGAPPAVLSGLRGLTPEDQGELLAAVASASVHVDPSQAGAYLGQLLGPLDAQMKKVCSEGYLRGAFGGDGGPLVELHRVVKLAIAVAREIGGKLRSEHQSHLVNWVGGTLAVMRASAGAAAASSYDSADLALSYSHELIRTAFVPMAPALAVRAVGAVGQVFGEYGRGFLQPLVGSTGGAGGPGGRQAGLLARRLLRPMGLLACIAEREVLDLSSEGTPQEQEAAVEATGAALLGGLRLVLPCIGPSVLEDEATRQAFLSMAQQAVTNHSAKLVGMPPAALAALVGAIASALASPRTELVSSAMSALYDLAEFHAGEVKGGSGEGPLSSHLRATPGLLGRLVGPVLAAALHPSRATVLGPRASQLLLAIAVCDPGGYRKAMELVAQGQGSPTLRDRFMRSVGKLMSGGRLGLDKKSRGEFRARFEPFLADAMGYVRLEGGLARY